MSGTSDLFIETNAASGTGFRVELLDEFEAPFPPPPPEETGVLELPPLEEDCEEPLVEEV